MTMKIGSRIGILIVVDEFEKWLATSLVTALYIFEIVTEESLIEYFGLSDCLVRFVGFSCFLGLFYIALGISVMRVIYIKGKSSVLHLN